LNKAIASSIVGVVLLFMILPVSAANASSYVGIVYKWTDCENFSRYSSTHVYIPDSPTNQLSITWAASEINFNGWTGWFCYQSNFFKMDFKFRDYTKTSQWAQLSFFMSSGDSVRYYYKVCNLFGCYPEMIDPGDLLQACTMVYYWASGWGYWHTDWHCTSWFQG
jgi:hypothetical protein